MKCFDGLRAVKVMKLPKLEKSEKYVGLFVVDFGDHAGVGFTAKEVAELLESERYSDCKVYKIHKAYPEGKIEMKGVQAQIFQLESGMVFYSGGIEEAKGDFKRLVSMAVSNCPPCRAKVELARYGKGKFAVVIIYPAEYEDDVSSWMLECNYRTQGAAAGGIDTISQYYKGRHEVIETRQLFEKEPFKSRSGTELLSSVRQAVQR
jgi:hypothetical protein